MSAALRLPAPEQARRRDTREARDGPQNLSSASQRLLLLQPSLNLRVDGAQLLLDLAQARLVVTLEQVGAKVLSPVACPGSVLDQGLARHLQLLELALPLRKTPASGATPSRPPSVPVPGRRWHRSSLAVPALGQSSVPATD